MFEEPERLHLDRSPNRHMSFGYGAHTCVGLHMARSEMKVAFEETLAASDDIRLTDPDAVVVAAAHLGATVQQYRGSQGRRGLWSARAR